MKLSNATLFLTLFIATTTVAGCNYRVFDLAEYSELQGTVPNGSTGNKLTEESFSSIYETVIKPQCLSCHSPDGSANLVLLDTYADLTSAEFGDPLIVPGNPEESVFYKVLLPSAGRKMMPPTKSGRPPVEPSRTEVIRSWIANGALESGTTPAPQPNPSEPIENPEPVPNPEEPVPQNPDPEEEVPQLPVEEGDGLELDPDIIQSEN